MQIALFTLLGVVVGLAIGIVLLKALQKQIQAKANDRAASLVTDAKRKADQILKDSERKAQDAVNDARRKFEQSVENKKRDVERAEQKAKEHERTLGQEKQAAQEAKEKAEAALMKAETKAAEYERVSKVAEQTEQTYRKKLNEVQSQLERVAGMTQNEARDALVANIEEDARVYAAKKVKVVEEQAKEEAEKQAKRVISIAISRFSSDYVPERTTSSITLPNDEMKGRLIGREGRNIRAIEQITGCDLIVDDTPETVVISCFDPVRRHIAKSTLEQLIADGRIHPGRVEELVEKITKQVNHQIKDAGEKACLELGIVDMHPELQKTIGQLQFRYSYTQNQYYHVLEVGHLCGLMAAELKLNVKKARRAGLLHDIGKALTHEIEGSHAVIGADLIEKYGEAEDIVYAVRAHHEDVPPKSWMDFLVIGADAISGARPGARREQLNNYVNRLQDLERIANNFQGVERSFAIAAGREIRVMVENSKVSDEQAVMLSRDIAKQIETDMTFPGQIKVTVIRETRAVSIAK